MLAQFALFVVGLFAVLTLVIDLGLVTLSRAQMQSAADAAALEGLRHREAIDADGYASDCVRRIAARDLVSWSFDDDLDPSAGDPRQFGAGPILAFTPGVGDLDAGRTISIPDPKAYKPDLAYNQAGNAPHGDMVSGTFTFDASPAPAEASDYTRSDFTASATPPPPGASALPVCPAAAPEPWPGPASGTPAIDDTAFLVRIRRSGDPSGLDAVPGVSSSGGALPLMFGRGALINSPDPAGGYSVRRDGLTVRATAIATARPALRVGRPAPGRLGVAPFVLSAAFAQTLTASPTAATIDATGLVLSGAANVGRFVAEPAAAVTVGQAVSVTIPGPACNASSMLNTIRGYAALFQPVGATAADRIVGFASIDLTWPDCAAAPSSVTLARTAPGVAPVNATASVPDLPADLPPGDVAEVFAATAALAASGSALLTPAGAR